MKKVFGQTVRDIKREVNKKVLKVPPVERKVLDATSNEPWGPHGSLLADIAQASRNYHEYLMIMAVIWKRINDTGKNWRHVYKALTVLEYLVAHGSERAIDEIREHTYQISALFDFQYIDSSGRDQGSNVRRKSQSLVALVNDKEQIQEVREKAAANMDKYSNTSTGDGMYRPGSQSNAGGHGDKYDEDRYGSRDDGSRNDDRYGRYGDSYGHDGDRYSRDNEERYGQDGYRDDDYHGRSQNSDYQNVSQSRSTDRNGNRAYEDDGQISSRGSDAKGDDHSQDGSMASRHLDRKYSDQSLGAPPSYEEIAGTARSSTLSERDGYLSAVPKASSPPASVSPSHVTTDASNPAPTLPPAPSPAPDNNGEVDGFGEFDPRGSFSALPATSNGTLPITSGGAEMDLLGSFSEPSSNSLALVSAAPGTAAKEANASLNSSSIPTFTPTSSPFTVSNQSFDDPFGDGPFKALPSTESVPAQQQIPTSTHSFGQNPYQSYDLPQPVNKNAENDFGGSFHGTTYSSSGPSGALLPSTEIPQFQQQELSNNDEDIDILADILPPSGASSHSHSQIDYPIPTNQPLSQIGLAHQTNKHESQSGLLTLQSQTAPQTGFHAQNSELTSLTDFPGQPGQSPLHTSYLPSAASPHVNSQADYPVPASQHVSQAGFPPHTNQPESQLGPLSLQSQTATQTGFHAQNSELTSLTAFPGQPGQSPLHTSYLPSAASPHVNSRADYPVPASQHVSQAGFPPHTNQPESQLGPLSLQSQTATQTGFHAQNSELTSLTAFPGQPGQSPLHTSYLPSAASPHVNSRADYPVPASQHVSQAGFPPHTNQPESQLGPLSLQSQTATQTGFHAQNSELASLTSFPGQPGQSPLHTSYLPSAASPHVNSQANYPVPANQHVSQAGFPPPTNQPESQLAPLSLQSQTATQTGFNAQNSELASLTAFPGQLSQPPLQTSYPLQQGQSVSQTNFLAQTNQSTALTFPSQASQTSQMGFPTHSSQAAGFPSQMISSQAGFHAPFRGQSSQPNANFYAGYDPQTGSTGAAAFHTVPQVSTGPVPQNNFLPQSGYNAPVASQISFQAPQVRPNGPIASQSASPASTGSATIVPQPSKDKFETKSTVWADTLSRGLVNLNISGPKTNPLADIGVDFDAINRKEKRMEKPTASTVTSNVTMGKAMGSGSGIGRAGAGALRPPPSAIMGSGMGMGMTSDPGSGFGMGGYSGNQSIGTGMNRPGNMGMGINMNMNMVQGYNMQQQPGFPPVSTMPGGYNPMTGTGNYGQQPYGGGYR